MFSYWADKWDTWRLRAKYERAVQARLVEMLTEKQGTPVAEDAGDWRLLGSRELSLTPNQRLEQRRDTRRMVQENPHARNVLRLLEAYVVGDGFRLTFAAKRNAEVNASESAVERVTTLWNEFLEANRAHFSYREFARRVWRDGECFLRIYRGQHWPPTVRFVDPEFIGGTVGDPDDDGIETEPGDVERVRSYRKVDPQSGALLERIAADEMLHSKYGADSNEKRGRSFFAALLDPLEKFQQWQDTELQARKLQSSIVLWRKVQGGPAAANALAETARTGGFETRQERVRPGTILTTSAGTDIQYLQPNTNFGDAVPLGRMILLGIAAGAGIPEFMLTSDAANGNYASTMVAEGPAVKLFQCEQAFFMGELTTLWRTVMAEAVFHKQLADSALDLVQPRWSTPQLVSRDRPRERAADAQLVQMGVLSRAEVQRREMLDPRQMQEELRVESSEVRDEE